MTKTALHPLAGSLGVPVVASVILDDVIGADVTAKLMLATSNAFSTQHAIAHSGHASHEAMQSAVQGSVVRMPCHDAHDAAETSSGVGISLQHPLPPTQQNLQAHGPSAQASAQHVPPKAAPAHKYRQGGTKGLWPQGLQQQGSMQHERLGLAGHTASQHTLSGKQCAAQVGERACMGCWCRV